MWEEPCSVCRTHHRALLAGESEGRGPGRAGSPAPVRPRAGSVSAAVFVYSIGFKELFSGIKKFL